MVLSAPDLDNFIEDEELVEEKPIRFKTARDGDHLFKPFQCDCYHFVNIHKRSPTKSTKDLNLAMAGRNFFDYIPLNLNAFQRHPQLEKVIVKKWLGKEWKTTKPEDWFYRSPMENGFGHLLQ